MADDNLTGKEKIILLKHIKENSWNPQQMSPGMMEREKRSIRDHGFIVPIIVRTVGKNSYEIIDGEHRFKAVKEIGYTTIKAIDLGEIQDHVAKALTLKLNDLRGAADEDKKAILVQELLSSFTPMELMETLPYDQDYYTQFPEFMEWTKASKELPDPSITVEADGVGLALPKKGNYDGLTLLHLLIENDQVKAFQAVAKLLISDRGWGEESFEVGLGKLVLELVKERE